MNFWDKETLNCLKNSNLKVDFAGIVRSQKVQNNLSLVIKAVFNYCNLQL